MGHREDDLKAQLLERNDEFRRLYDEHRDCDERLHEYSRKSFLSSEEQFEERKLKKQKLMLKDRMEVMKSRYSNEPAET